jgi:RNA polymerase sigma-70 factor (ECF subfamily)
MLHQMAATMSNALQTRESLLARLRTGSADADWEAFYKQYGAVILSFCTKRGLDEFGARDVLQETMILLMRKLPDFDYSPQKGRFRNWLLALVAGKVRDAHRRARRRRTVSFDGNQDDDSLSLAERLVADSLQGSEALERIWMEGLLEEALRRIRNDPKTKPETFAVFQAYVVAGKPVVEVARKFGLQQNAVYQIKNRLVKRLREEISRLDVPCSSPATQSELLSA